ncbi:MAG TPA: twin-arginine translocation signal domain-containing protein, partial [Pseudolabrys sp.]|nr:twin-arginine translocation signal domain-containing protein [Pseudolabrys sp.]
MPTRRNFLGATAAALALGRATATHAQQTGDPSMTPDLILHNGLVTTLDRTNPTASAVAIKDG